MRADYDSRLDTLAIELVAVEHAEHGDDQTYPAAVVGIHEGRAVTIDLLAASSGVDQALTAVATQYALDRDALLALARAALTVPDRQVVLEVHAAAAA